MGKAEAGSTKAIANAIKAKGLGRLRWYCQVCEKQCRDENGFQAHTKSESHLRKILLLGPKAGAVINDYSTQFQSEFILLLRTRHLTNRVQANKVYNEYIQDKHHIHMNATRWVTLGGFVATIGKAGLVKVDEDDKGLWIQWIDSRPETLARQAAIQKSDRSKLDGEERERLALQEQIARARAQEAARIQESGQTNTGLQKKEGEKITLSFQPVSTATGSSSSGPPPISDADASEKQEGGAEASSSSAAATSIPAGPSSTDASPSLTSFSLSGPSSSGTAMKAAPISVNPLKRPATTNVFKSASAKAAKTDPSQADLSAGGAGKKGYLSEAERLMKEDQARKAARSGGSGGPGAGYGGHGPVRSNKPVTGRYY